MSRGRIAGAVVLGLALVAGLRLWVAAAAVGKSFADNAVVGLMALHALRGHFYPFYWGQAYMGSIESLVVAPFLAILGANDLALSAGLLPWTLLWTLATSAIAAREAGVLACVLALLLCALAPSEVQYYQVTARGGYPETLALGAAIVWLALRLAGDELGKRSALAHGAVLGLVAGLAFWTNWLVLPFYVGAGAALLAGGRRVLVRPWVVAAAIAFALGSAPFWIENVRSGFATFALTRVANRPRLGDTVRWLVELGVPNVLGLRDLHGVWPAGGPLAAIAVATGAVASLVHGRGRFAALARGDVRAAGVSPILWITALATIVVYAAGLPGRFQIGRYLLPLAGAAIPLAAIDLATLVHARRGLGLAIVLVVAAFYASGTVNLVRDFRGQSGRYTAGPADALAAELERAGIRCGYAPYSDAAVVTWVTAERVVLQDYEDRYYPAAEFACNRPALVTLAGAESARDSLATLSARFDERRVAGYAVAWPIEYDGVPRAPLPRDGWRLSSDEDGQHLDRLVDGDPLTYWTVRPDRAHAALTIDLGSEQDVAGLDLALGGLRRDGFRRAEVEASSDGVAWRLVREAAWSFPVSFDEAGAPIVRDEAQTILFPPVRARSLRLTLLEPTPDHWWSIGELGVLGVAQGERGLRSPQYPITDDVLARRFEMSDAEHPETDRWLRALADLRREHGDAAALAEIERRRAGRFTPRALVRWRFEDGLELVGYDAAILGPRSFEITYIWRAHRAMRTAYALTSRLTLGDAHVADDAVIATPATTETWEPGETVKETRRLELPADAPDGRHAFRVGVWDPVAREHLGIGWRRRERETLFDIVLADGQLRIEAPR